MCVGFVCGLHVDWSHDTGYNKSYFNTDASTGKLCTPTEAQHKHNPVNANIVLYTGIFKV